MAVEELFTVKEVAAALKQNTKAVYEALRTGSLKGTRLGRSWRVRAGEVDKYLARHTAK
jgi:excisionase family DNA binding protein